MIKDFQTRALEWGNRFLYKPASPYPLAVCRIIFFGWLFLWYLGKDLSMVSYQHEAVWNPVLLIRMFGVEEIPERGTLLPLLFLWRGALLTACLGFMTRFSSLLCCVIGAYLISLTHSFWKINHSDGALVIAMGFFALSKAGDVLSIDSLIRRKIGGKPLPVRPDAEYRWPIQFVRVLLMVIFFAAGIAKLRNSGLEWVFSENQHTILWYAKLTREPLVDLNLDFPGIGLLCKGMALFALGIELIAPLALFDRRAAAVIVSSLFLLQTGITVLMRDDFTQFAVLYAFWLPWDRHWPANGVSSRYSAAVPA